MCGLIGQFALTEKTFYPSTHCLRHRGPDSSGHWLSKDKHCWLGHTRLAILDLSPAGHQPFISHCGSITIVFNGEIYNHLELRKKIRFSNWRSQSDTETLAEGLAQFGLSFLLDLRGMFAFAAYITESCQLVLARDRLGIKPLYYQWSNDILTFASERQAIASRQPLSRSEVAEVLSYGHLLTCQDWDRSPSNQINSLPPGTTVRVNLNRPDTFIRYWPPQPSPEWSALPLSKYSNSSTVLRKLLEQAVALHLQSDVRIACFLSGGLDSAILASLASLLGSSPVDSFTVSLQDSRHDEFRDAALVATHCHSRHHKVLLDSSEVLDWITHALHCLDVPTVDSLNTYVVSRAAAEHGFKVALSGLGADELFGGYPSHKFVPLLRLLGFIPSSARELIIRKSPAKFRERFSDLSSWSLEQVSIAFRRWVSNSTLTEVGLVPLSPPKLPESHLPHSWSKICWAELFSYTEPMLLRDADVMSMSHGLEVRVPFLDHRLVEFALRLPKSHHRLHKKLLYDSCSDILPTDFRLRPKKGFYLPMREWMLGPLLPLCNSKLLSLCDSGSLNPIWVNQVWSDFVCGAEHWTKAWALVVLGEFVDRSATSRI